MIKVLKVVPILILSLTLASCGSTHKTATSSTVSTTTSTTAATTTTTSTTTTQPGVVPAIGNKTYVTSVASPQLTANISYPVLGGMASGALEESINSAIFTTVKGYVSSFESQVGEQSGQPASGGGGGLNQSQISGSFTTEFVDSKYVSFKFLITSYTANAASPSTKGESLTFDLGNGSLMSLDNLFSSSDYLSTLSKLVRAQLASKLGQNSDQNFIDSGTQPVASNFAAWNLTGSGLEFTFAQGQVAAAATGVQSVTVPYALLSGIARTPGPLTSL